MKLYALHDKKAKSLSSFHVERSDTVASRGFVDAVLAKDSVFAKYPEDFELVSLCDVSQDYDDQWPVDMVDSIASKVILTAEQVIASQPSKQQLELLKEA